MKTVTTISMTGLPYAPMEMFLMEKPPVPATAMEWTMESYHGIPASRNAKTSMTVSAR